MDWKSFDEEHAVKLINSCQNFSEIIFTLARYQLHPSTQRWAKASTSKKFISDQKLLVLINFEVVASHITRLFATAPAWISEWSLGSISLLQIGFKLIIVDNQTKSFFITLFPSTGCQFGTPLPCHGFFCGIWKGLFGYQANQVSVLAILVTNSMNMNTKSILFNFISFKDSPEEI